MRHLPPLPAGSVRDEGGRREGGCSANVKRVSGDISYARVGSTAGAAAPRVSKRIGRTAPRSVSLSSNSGLRWSQGSNSWQPAACAVSRSLPAKQHHHQDSGSSEADRRGAHTGYTLLRHQRDHPAVVSPPETLINWPVMNPASSLARKQTAPTTSCGWPMRPSGVARRIRSSN